MKANRFSSVPSGCLLLAGLLLTSCGSTVYTNVGHNVPLFHKKGEMTINGGIAMTDHTNGGGFQVAAAPSDKIALISSFYSGRGSTTMRTNTTYWELGGGRYWYQEDTGASYELLAGVGFGSLDSDFQWYNSTGASLRASYAKYFIQPSIGYGKKVLEVAFTPRFGLVQYNGWSANTTDAQAMIDLSDFYANRKNNFVFEPGLTLRLGYKWVKFQAQYSYSTFGYAASPSIQVDRDYFSMGLHFLITDRWANKK